MEIPDMEPSNKSVPMQTFLEAMMGRNTAIANSRCLPFCCGREIPAEEFATWTEIQQREYPISGMCNNCQDIAFAPFNEADFEEVDRPEIHDVLPPESDDLDGDRPWMRRE